MLQFLQAKMTFLTRLLTIQVFLAISVNPGQKNTEWLLGHCLGEGKVSDVACFTDKSHPVSCLPVRNVKDCKSASNSFTETSAAELLPLDEFSFAVDIKENYLCFNAHVSPADNMNTYLGTIVRIEDRQRGWQSPESKLGCFYPKRLSSAEELKRTWCCKKFSTEFLKGTRFDATVHSIPAHLNSLPQYGVFHSGGLPRISLEDYLMDFVDTSAEDNSIDDEKKQTVFSESEFERSTWVIIVVLLIAISLVTAFIVGILLVNKFWSVEPRIQKKKGEAFTENENIAGYSNFGFTMCSFELATGPKMTTKDVTIPPETDLPPTF